MTSSGRNHVAIAPLPHARWEAEIAPDFQREAAAALERGDVLFLSELAFDVSNGEEQLFSAGIAGSSKNVGFDPVAKTIGGTVLDGDERQLLAGMMARFSRHATTLADRLLPAYRGRVAQGRTSFRPVEIEGRQTSWRKDDTRLHVDAFPATPVHGRRILRVFTNVNPERRPRTWRVGEPFDIVARRFAPQLRLPAPGVATALRWLRVTKTPRTPYDALMLQLHDRMKGDDAYQSQCAQMTMAFPAGSTWLAFTDQVSHAAMAGQYQLEQTFLLPVRAMIDEQRSPLRILERLKGRRLA